VSLLDSLISWWELDEASGTRNDSHGTNHLTDNNTVGRATTDLGLGADFEASSSEYLSRASNASLQTGDIDFTFALWFVRESSGGYVLLGKDSDSTGRDYTIDTVGGNVRLYINGGGGGLIAQATMVDVVGSKHLVVAWHDATANTLNIQVNNGVVSSVGTGGAAPPVSAAEFRIGAREYGGAEGYTDGVVDQVGFWKRVLTTSERARVYNNGQGLLYSDVNPAFRGMQDGSRPGAVRPGAFRLGGVATALAPTATPALYFNGLDAFVEIPAATSAVENLPTGPFTLAFLIRGEGFGDEIYRSIVDFATSANQSTLNFSTMGSIGGGPESDLRATTDQMGASSGLDDAVSDLIDYVLVVRWDGVSAEPVFSRLPRGVGSWTHDDGSGSSFGWVPGTAITGGKIRLGVGFFAGSDGFEGVLGLSAGWDSYLSDPDVESLVEADDYTIYSSEWQALNPLYLHHPVSETEMPDVMGNGNDATTLNTVYLVDGFEDVFYTGMAPGGGDATVAAVPADAARSAVVPGVAAGATVAAALADGTGALTVPAAGAGASVVTPTADATGGALAPAVSAGAVVISPAVAGAGDALAPAVGAASSDATVTALPAAGSGDLPAPTAGASMAVAAVVADGTGAALASAQVASASVVVGPASGSGDEPAPLIFAGGGITLDVPPGAGSGDAGTPEVSASREVVSGPAVGAGDALNPSAVASALLSAIPALGVGDGAPPIVTGLIYGVYTGTGRAPAGTVRAGANGGLSVAPAGTLRP